MNRNGGIRPPNIQIHNTPAEPTNENNTTNVNHHSASKPEQVSFYGPNKLHIAVENKQLPSSPLDEIGFQVQLKKKNHGTANTGTSTDINNGQGHDEDNEHITESVIVNETSGLDALESLERRFSMVSIESSATTGRLLDHLGLTEDDEQIDWSNYSEHKPIRTNNTNKDRNLQVSNQIRDKRLPQVPTNKPIQNIRHLQYQQQQQQLQQQQQQQQQQKRVGTNVAPAEKFPSLQRRFVRPSPQQPMGPTTNGYAPLYAQSQQQQQQIPSQPPAPQHQQQQPQVESPKPTEEPIIKASPNPRTPIASPKMKQAVLQPSSLPKPRVFAKDFSDQFENVSPQRRAATSPYANPVRPKHAHSHSNPTNMYTSSNTTSSSFQATATDRTPSPRQPNTHRQERPLQRTPSTPVQMKDLNTKRLIFAKSDEVPAETRVALAMKLKHENQPQEASYQLQLAAEQGNREAMLLYGLALRYGYGLKKDERQSFLWLSRAADIDLIRTYQFEVDPFQLTEANVPKQPREPIASTMFEIGKAYMNGWGVDRDENYGIQFIEKSASLGFVEAMLEAGNTWCTKGLHRKKNMHRSACWFRLADKFGKKLIGNSWIYKPKYMERV